MPISSYHNMPNPPSDSKRGLSLTAHAISASSMATTSSGAGTKHSNLFKSLANFFREDDFLQQSRHAEVIAELLEDFILRKGYTFNSLVREFAAFFHTRSEGGQEQQCRTFLQAIFLVFSNTGSLDKRSTPICRVSSFEALLHMLWELTHSFQDIFNGLCGSNNHLNSPSKGRVSQCRQMHTMLHYGLNVDVTFRSKRTRFINAPMMYGETALVLASRNRRPDVILLLLRHGADVTTSWLCYENALEVLLFAPTKQFVCEEEKRKIEESVEYYLRAMKRVNFKRLETLREDGYTQLHERWTDLVPLDYVKHPAPLGHLARCSIREALDQNRKLPSAISQLPVPNRLKNYIDLHM